MPFSVGFWHVRSGDSLTLELFHPEGGGIANGPGGDSFSEPDPLLDPGFYVATVAEEISGVCIARVRRSGQLLYSGLVTVPGESELAVIDSVPPGDLRQILGRALTESTPGLLAANWQTLFLNDGVTSDVSLGDLTGGSTGSGSVTVASLSPAALAQLASRRVITVSVPGLVENQLSWPLVQGDSYLATQGRALDFSRADFPDIDEGSLVTLTARQEGEVGGSFMLNGSVVVSTGVKVVRFEATSDQTRDYPPGKYRFDIQVEFPDGNVATFVGPQTWLLVVAPVEPSGG